MARILLVDDDISVRGVFARMLRQAQHDVVEAADGYDAVRCLREAFIDVMVTDITMPRMDGIELLMVVKKEFPRLPIIVMSGSSLASDMSANGLAEKLGAKMSLAKPFRFAALERAVAAVLSLELGDEDIQSDSVDSDFETEVVPSGVPIPCREVRKEFQALQGGNAAL